MAMATAISDERQHAYALHGVGKVLMAEGDLQQARKKLEQALKDAPDNG